MNSALEAHQHITSTSESRHNEFKKIKDTFFSCYPNQIYAAKRQSVLELIQRRSECCVQINSTQSDCLIMSHLGAVCCRDMQFIEIVHDYCNLFIYSTTAPKHCPKSQCQLPSLGSEAQRLIYQEPGEYILIPLLAVEIYASEMEHLKAHLTVCIAMGAVE